MHSSPPKSRKSNTERTPYSSNTQDAIHIQDGYCSPERPSYNNSSKQTPKSILKEYTNTSGSKSKKGIVINETLNETRKLSLRSENSEISASKGKKRPMSAANTSLASFEAQVYGSSQKNGPHQTVNRKGLGALWTPEGFNTGTRSHATQELSDFQKAYVKKLQRDREQELYCELVRRSNDSLSKGNKTLSQEENTNFEYEDNKQLIRTIEHKRKSLDDRGKSKRPQQESVSSLDRVEEKIEQLEKCLDVYSNRLRDSILRQKDQLVAGQFIKTGNIPETLPIRSWEKESVPRDLMDYYLSRRENKTDRDDYEKSKHYLTNERWESFNNELNQLREEKRHLESKLPKEAAQTFTSTRNENNDTVASKITDKEVELLKTVEEIRAKLYNSLSQKSIDRRSDQNKTGTLTKTDYTNNYNNSTLKTKKTSNSKHSKTKTSENLSKYQKMRKAYGESTLERENACILNEGLSSIYNGFHWNADNSLKITRNI